MLYFNHKHYVKLLWMLGYGNDIFFMPNNSWKHDNSVVYTLDNKSFQLVCLLLSGDP